MALSRDIFVGETVSWHSERVGEITFGVVDASRPGVAEGISRLLVRSIQDARAEVGGHLPSWLVGDIERNYISPEKVRTLWAAHGHRFAMLAGSGIIGTVHVARTHAVVLTADRTRNNVPASDLPGLAPARHHQVVNVSVLHELRRAGLAARMFDEVTTTFRHLFDGEGLWVRADPPWHAWLTRLGFVHDPSFDVFLPEEVERTAGLPHADFNRLHACACEGVDTETRIAAMQRLKLQYVSMTRGFAGPRTFVPASADDVREIVTRAAREGKIIAARGASTGSPPERTPDWYVSTRAFDRIRVADDGTHVAVGAGVTWRALLEALPRGRLPPVVPGYVEATIGGAIATGGIGKGSAQHGLVVDHVRDVVREGDIILGATLPLVVRRPYVVVTKNIVGASALASALDVDAFHAFATKTPEGWLAIVARESDDESGATLEAFVTPKRSPPPPGFRFTRTFIDAPRLGPALAATESASTGEITVHPVRRPGRALAYAVTITSTRR